MTSHRLSVNIDRRSGFVKFEGSPGFSDKCGSGDSGSERRF